MSWLVSALLAFALAGAPTGATAVAGPDVGDGAPLLLEAPTGGDELPEPPPSEEQTSPDDHVAWLGPVGPAPLLQGDGIGWVGGEMPPSVDLAVPVPPPLR